MKNQEPHDQIEARLLILIFGLAMALGGKVLWVNIVGWVFVTIAVLRLLWRDVYRAMQDA
jgi:hypothetical protein